MFRCTKRYSGSITRRRIRGLLHTQVLQEAKDKRREKRKRCRGSESRSTPGFGLQRKGENEYIMIYILCNFAPPQHNIMIAFRYNIL